MHLDRLQAKDSIFVLSGILALSLYVLLLLLTALFFKLNSAHIKISINAPSALQSISVNLVEVPIKQEIAESTKIDEKITPKTENKAKDSGSKSALSGMGASELFSKIDTKKPTPSKKTQGDNRDKVALNKKGDNAKSEALNKILQKTQNIANTLENLNSNIMITDSSASRFCEKYSDYCRQITEFLYKSWNIKSAFNEPLSSLVQISVSKDGNFSYTIKKKSGNSTFDSELAESLQRLQSQTFPTLENVVIDKLEVNFMNKDRG